MNDPLTIEEKQTLLKLARLSLEAAVRRQPPPQISPGMLIGRLGESGASFVTLTISGRLRGCIGALEAYQGLAEDVREHAAAAALEDPRFPPVSASELDSIAIEVSRLTPAVPLAYRDAQDLLEKLRPGVDGVILNDGWRRATFLPQVWKSIPDPADFLANLCLKMGASPQVWQQKHMDVLIYQVEEFHE